MKAKTPSLRVAVISVNWLGDAVMAMPAIQRLNRMRPDWCLVVITKPPLAALWEMHDAVRQVIPVADDRAAIQALRGGHFDRVYVLPNSFRSAWWSCRSKIPERFGSASPVRRLLLSHAIDVTKGDNPPHQAYEMLNVFGIEAMEGEILTPRLSPPQSAREEAATLLGTKPRLRLGLIPGAARGPSKRWPAEHFLELGRRLLKQADSTLVLFGTAADASACEALVDGLDAPVLNLAGKTSLPVFAACLEACDAVVANDSGGMHLATAVGTPVVGLFGLTDPSKTGPLGEGNLVLQKAGGGRRKIARDSAAAVECLAAILPQEVEEGVLSLVNRNKAP